MKKILVPFDFSNVSNYSLDFALQMASKISDCEVTLFHVIEQPSASAFKTMGVSDYDPMKVMYLKDLIEQVGAKLDEVLSNLSLDGVNVTHKVKLGNPDIEITEEVEGAGIDLIVMGTSGSEGLDEFFVGSNAEKVVRHASCPVITMKGEGNLENINDIVFASDFANVDQDFVEKLLRLQEILDAQLRIVKVNTPASFTTSRFDNKLMNDFAAKNGITNFTTDIYNFSNEEDGIVAYSEDINADMIALGTHQMKGVGHFLKGSIAEDVVNHSQIPVWTYHLK